MDRALRADALALASAPGPGDTDRFWEEYLTGSRDALLAEVIAPYFAWRALVLARPTWYPQRSGTDRERMPTFAEAVLQALHFRPELAEAAFE